MHELLVNCLFKLAQEKVWLGELTVPIGHEIISLVILLPSAELFMKDRCQSQAKVCAQITGQLFVQACLGKSMVR